MNAIIYKKIYQHIEGANNILAVTHEKPDGDALGSVCAVAELLIEMKKTFTIFCVDQAPSQYHFLPNIEILTSDKDRLNFETFDLILIFDCGDMRRTGLVKEIKNKNKNQFIINIDHHPKVEEFADLEIKKVNAASTSEIVYELFKENKIVVNKNMATCLLAGISSDTGNFLYPSTSDKTVEISSEMLSLGASLPHIIESTWHNKSLSAMKIWGKAMSNLQINKKYGIAFTALTLADIVSSGIKDEELEGIANFLGNLKGVKAILFLREQADGTIKGSLRSAHPQADVSRLARLLGGGGHSKASGFTVKGKLVQEAEKWKIV